MTKTIQNLLNLAKVDNSRETFDKLAKALEVAVEILRKLDNLPTHENNNYEELHNSYCDMFELVTQGLEKIHIIAGE